MKTAVIGSGIGGLISALLVAKDGHDVTVYEKESSIGGRLAFIQEGEYKIDKGPTIVLLPDMLLSILKESGVNTDEIDFVRCDPLYDVHFADGQVYRKFADLDKQYEEIKREFPGDENGFLSFMKDMEERFTIGKPQFLESSFSKPGDYLNTGTIGSLLKLKAYRNVMGNLNHYFNHEKLRTAYGLQTLYIGGDPYTTPAIYSLVSFSEHQHGIYYIKGGYASLLDHVKSACDRVGITIKTSTPVNEIETDGDTATGLVMGGGRREAVDAVIVNGDFPLASRLLKKETPKRYKPSSGCVLLYMGVDGRFDEMEMHQFFLSEDFSRNMEAIFKHGEIPGDPSFYVFNPSKVDGTLAPEGKSVLYVLIPVPATDKVDWESASEYLSRQVLDTMEKRGFRSLAERIEWMKVRTPLTAMQDGLYAGGSFGIAPSLGQSGPFRPQVQPFKERNIFAVGASIHPGGGVPIVMQGAKLVREAFRSYCNTQSERKDVSLHEHDFGSVQSL
ncbi:phytoene desaturase family protein [Bacillus sp. KH172YL63]|uniref:phytoene desaturase family protein n=1 Tax=Bacillus sp. KH172YL63 TaxID=2709784 RepID=UPI0013E4E693|nr:phytoene desaturase family protein [Bacillus sp. KH172YL63]BCB02998.1 dehydrosqualene desaturase [Bacillus sp. KH172YL63]